MTRSIHKMVKDTLKSLQHMLQDLERGFDYFYGHHVLQC